MTINDAMKALAEKLEPNPKAKEKLYTVSRLGFWDWNWAAAIPFWLPVDFLHSEDASARLLDAMLEENTGVDIQHWSDTSYNTIKRGQPFCVTLDACIGSNRVEFEGRAADRKTAVFLAALAWKEIPKPEGLALRCSDKEGER